MCAKLCLEFENILLEITEFMVFTYLKVILNSLLENSMSFGLFLRVLSVLEFKNLEDFEIFL